MKPLLMPAAASGANRLPPLHAPVELENPRRPQTVLLGGLLTLALFCALGTYWYLLDQASRSHVAAALGLKSRPPLLVTKREMARPYERWMPVQKGDVVFLRSESKTVSAGGNGAQIVTGLPRDTVVTRDQNSLRAVVVLGANSFLVAGPDGSTRIIDSTDIESVLLKNISR